MNICFDLDGPIVDVSDRYYRAYLESLKGYDISSEHILSKEDFWKFKQNRVTDIEIGILTGLTFKEAKKSADLRRKITFLNEFLPLDKLYGDVIETFNFLNSKGIPFFMATLRRDSQMQYAVKQFKLDKYLNNNFLFALEEEQKVEGDIQEKYTLFFSAINKLHLNPQETWIIGDSDTDIHAARLAKIKTIVGITRGIRSKEQLEILAPDYIVSNLKEFVSLIK